MRRRLLVGLAVVLVAGAGLALGSGPAMAKYVHGLEESREVEPGAGGEGFHILLADAVDNSDGPSQGSLYLLEAKFSEGEALNVSKFDQSGAPLLRFDGSETPDGSLGSLELILEAGIAVDSSGGPNQGDVYVLDTQHDVVNRFGEDGRFICQITGSAALEPTECNGLVGSQTPDGGFAPTGIAVDGANGDVYVSDSQHDAIYKFDSSGAYLGALTDPRLQSPTALALDSAGSVYVVVALAGEATELIKLSPTGSFLTAFDDNEPMRVAVDQAAGRVYVAERIFEGQIAEFDTDGTPIGSFGATELLLAPSLALDESSGRIYVTNTRFGGSALVEVYGPGGFVPDVVTGAASNVGEATATLNGLVDPAGGGEITSCAVELVADADYDGEVHNPYAAGPPPVPCSQAMPLPDVTAVSAEVGGLAPSQTYHYRFVAANSNGIPSYGGDQVFSTAGPPTIDEQSATAIERTGATLQAKVNPHGYETEFRFEYVDAEHYEKDGGFASAATRSTLFSQVGSSLVPLAVNQGVSGLELNTTYHYRAVAKSSRGTAFGPDLTFTTVPVVALDGQWAYAHLNSATLEADINPLGAESSCHAELVGEAEFQRSGFAGARRLPCAEGLGSGSAKRTARVEVGGLEKDSTYHFRFVVENQSGSVTGAGQSFTTFGIEEFSVDVVDEHGEPFTQAGGYPFESITHYAYNYTMVPSRFGLEGSVNAFVKDVLTSTPPGRVGGAVATPRCPGYLVDEEKCSGDAQVGTITIEYYDGGSRATRTRALYNVFAPEGKASRFSSIDPYVSTDARVRTGGDYGTTIGAFNITEEARIVGVTARIWGVPADPRHDPQRRCPGVGTGCPSGAPPRPLLRNPTLCGGPLTSSGLVDTWQGPGDYVAASHPMPAMSGCELVGFDPSVSIRPTTEAADTPTGLRVRIHVPQDEDAEGIATADLRDAVIELPEGLAINSSAAGGLAGCSPAQIDLGGDSRPRCPDAAKVGTVEAVTPLLDDPLRGGIYVATPRDNPFGSLFAIYVAIDDPGTGVTIKLAGELDADARSGRLTATFRDSPQLPFEDFVLDFFDGPRALLRTQQACGAHDTLATLTPWSAPQSGPPARLAGSYSISTGPNRGRCVASEGEKPNAPVFSAGTTPPVAGAYAPLLLRLARDDASQRISTLSVDLPPGLLARTAGVAQCSDGALATAASRPGQEELASPSCPPGSALGDVAITSGAGPAPTAISGGAYLAGPYKGAPLSLAVVVPAVTGPFDLGTVVVRSALQVNVDSARITVQSDPLPTMLQGVPLDIRSVAVKLDRPGFTLNPTSCEPMSVTGTMTSTAGRPAGLADRFRVGGCGKLGFRPRLGLRLFGAVQRGSHPRLRAELTMPQRSAGIDRVAVTLPPSQFLANEHLRGICSREQFAARACPPESVYGYAQAWSPLLDAPLRGPIYLRSSKHRLPDLLADLDGQIRFVLRGRIDSARGGIRVNIESVPDVPVSRFVMTMRGGSRGLLQNSTNVCAAPQRAHIALEAHNGRAAHLRPLLRAQCRGGE